MEDILGLVFFGFTDSVSSIFLEFDTVTILKKTKVKRKQKLYKQSQFLKYCV